MIYAVIFALFAIIIIVGFYPSDKTFGEATCTTGSIYDNKVLTDLENVEYVKRLHTLKMWDSTCNATKAWDEHKYSLANRDEAHRKVLVYNSIIKSRGGEVAH